MVGEVDVLFSSTPTFTSGQRISVSGNPALPDLPQSVNNINCYKISQRIITSDTVAFTVTSQQTFVNTVVSYLARVQCINSEGHTHHTHGHKEQRPANNNSANEVQHQRYLLLHLLFLSHSRARVFSLSSARCLLSLLFV